MNITNLTEEGLAIQKLAERLTVITCDHHEVGFQDGGCLLFAHLINTIALESDNDSKIVSIGRFGNCDHFVVRVVLVDDEVVYIDSDGIFTEDEIKYKLWSLELMSVVSLPDDIVIENYDESTVNANEIIFNEETIKELYTSSSSELKEIFNDFSLIRIP